MNDVAVEKVEEDPLADPYNVRRINGKIWLPPRGDTEAPFMIICSHPGFADLESKELLSGESGEELNNALAIAGIHNEKDVYITSMVKYGIGSKPKPTSEQVEECAALLDWEIATVKPKLIMTLGAEVFKRLMKANGKVTDYLGEIIDCPYGKIIPNWAPGMILNVDPKERPFFQENFELAQRFLKGTLNYTPFSWIVVDDPNVNKEIVKHYMDSGQWEIGYDGEWKPGQTSTDNVMYTFQYSCEDGKAIILDLCKDGKEENLELLDTMKPILEHPKCKRMGWSIRSDDKQLVRRGFKLTDETLYFDGMKAVAFLDSRWKKDLGTGIRKFTSYKPYYNALTKARKEHKLEPKNLAEVKFKDPEVFWEYCAGDAVSHYTACRAMKVEIDKLPKVQRDFYYNTYLPLSNYLLDMEMEGIPIDQEVMEDITKKYDSKYGELLIELRKHTSKLGFDTAVYEESLDKLGEEKTAKLGLYEDFNPNSNPHKKALLFTKLKLNPAYYTKTGKPPKPRAWYEKQKPQTKALYSPSSNGSSLSTIRFELTAELQEKPCNATLTEKLHIVKTLLDLNRVGVFSKKFLNKRGTEYLDDDFEDAVDDDEEPLKSSYWAALCPDKRIHADFYECLDNFRSSSRPNVQNPASKVLSHIPEIFVPGYLGKLKEIKGLGLDKAETKKLVTELEKPIPRNIRHIFYSGDKDWKWAESDCSGADLIINAYLSRDCKYIKDMLDGNFHLKKAKQYFQDETITKDDYSKYVSSKAITFRVAYTSELQCAAIPIQAAIFAESGIDIPIKTVEYALNTWNGYDKYIAFRERCVEQVKEKCYIENGYGVKYHFEQTDNFGIKAGYYNQSLAFMAASELAMFLWNISVAMRKELKKQGVWMKYIKPANSVHDAKYWIIHKDLMTDNYFPEVTKHFFTKQCKLSTGDTVGMEMAIADRWKGVKSEEIFHGETQWDFKNKCWNWK